MSSPRAFRRNSAVSALHVITKNPLLQVVAAASKRHHTSTGRTSTRIFQPLSQSRERKHLLRSALCLKGLKVDGAHVDTHIGGDRRARWQSTTVSTHNDRLSVISTSSHSRHVKIYSRCTLGGGDRALDAFFNGSSPSAPRDHRRSSNEVANARLAEQARMFDKQQSHTREAAVWRSSGVDLASMVAIARRNSTTNPALPVSPASSGKVGSLRPRRRSGRHPQHAQLQLLVERCRSGSGLRRGWCAQPTASLLAMGVGLRSPPGGGCRAARSRSVETRGKVRAAPMGPNSASGVWCPLDLPETFHFSADGRFLPPRRVTLLSVVIIPASPSLRRAVSRAQRVMGRSTQRCCLFIVGWTRANECVSPSTLTCKPLVDDHMVNSLASSEPTADRCSHGNSGTRDGNWNLSIRFSRLPI